MSNRISARKFVDHGEGFHAKQKSPEEKFQSTGISNVYIYNDTYPIRHSF